MHRKFYNTAVLIILIALGFLCIGGFIGLAVAVDNDNDGIDDTEESGLIKKYAPNLYFVSGENFYPVDCGYHINNSKLYRWENTTKVLVDADPNSTSLAGYGPEYFLDNELGGYEEILKDYKDRISSLGYTIYGRVINKSGYIYVQYWFFYAYNDYSLNQHEGDWESITIILDASGNPIGAAYSQHHSGEYAAWADVEKTDGTHPNVYVARGSHANYFRPYQGRLGLENDIVGKDGFVLTYDNTALKIEVLGENGTGNHPPDQSWLDFGGRWGDWKNISDAFLGLAGPNGPAYGENAEKWAHPDTWSNGLFKVNSNWFIAANLMYNLGTVLWIIFGLSVTIKIIGIIRNSKKREESGTKFGAAGGIGILFGFAAFGFSIAAVFTRWYGVYLGITGGSVNLEGDILIIDGINGISVNMLGSGGGMTPLFNFALPFYIPLFMGIILSILDIFKVRSSRKLGVKYIISGIFFVAVLAAIIIFVSQVGALVDGISRSLGIALPPESTEIINKFSAAPTGGSYSTTIPDVGSVVVIWGLQTGGFLLMTAAILKILGGIILLTKKSK